MNDHSINLRLPGELWTAFQGVAEDRRTTASELLRQYMAYTVRGHQFAKSARGVLVNEARRLDREYFTQRGSMARGFRVGFAEALVSEHAPDWTPDPETESTPDGARWLVSVEGVPSGIIRFAPEGPDEGFSVWTVFGGGSQ